MKSLYIIIPVLIIIVIAFLWQQPSDNDYSKIEFLIQQNSNELVKGDITVTKAEERKLALEIAAKIQAGECPTSLDDGLKSYAIKNLASKALNDTNAKEVVNCIDSLGIKQEQHYSLMVDLLAFWDKQNLMLELFYLKFFKGYKTPDPSILGLLDNAKLMCAKGAIQYLKKENYPENAYKIMTEKEYSLFEKYINEFRCGA